MNDKKRRYLYSLNYDLTYYVGQLVYLGAFCCVCKVTKNPLIRIFTAGILTDGMIQQYEHCKRYKASEIDEQMDIFSSLKKTKKETKDKIKMGFC